MVELQNKCRFIISLRYQINHVGHINFFCNVENNYNINKAIYDYKIITDFSLDETDCEVSVSVTVKTLKKSFYFEIE